MIKIVYFDVQNDEKDFFIKNNDGKYEYYLDSGPLNEYTNIQDDYKDAQIISVFTTSRVTKEVLDKFENLQMIALRSVGYNHIDIDYCNKAGVVVENTPNYGNKSVAEFAFALLSDVARKVTRGYIEYKEGNVLPHSLTGVELAEKTIGIIGLGAIGAEVAKIAYGYDMKIIGYDLYENDKLKQNFKVEYKDFDTVLKESDFISLHTPLTKHNYHMFDYSAFNLMKKNSILVNTARGELIETQALYNAIIKKEIAGAGLDVLESEETITDSDYLKDINRLSEFTLKQTLLNTRLLQLQNVIITPHIAYNTHEAIGRILTMTMSNIASFLEGVVEHNVN